jgi:hypothetical protein
VAVRGGGRDGPLITVESLGRVQPHRSTRLPSCCHFRDASTSENFGPKFWHQKALESGLS